MQFLHLSTAVLACLSSAVVAHGNHHPVRDVADSTLEVTLEAASPSDATNIKATIKNVGSQEARLLKVGTVLDERPVKKLTVLDSNGSEVPFLGIELSLLTEALEPRHYEPLAPGSSISRQLDATFVHDFEPGTYSLVLEGVLPTESGSPIAYRSNTITLNLATGSVATMRKMAEKRTTVMEPCSNRTVVDETVSNCGKLARASAADAADVHSQRFVEYFKTNATAAREQVVRRLEAVARECEATPGGNTSLNCQDIPSWNYCVSDGPLVAYTIWVNGYIVLCPLFYERPALPQECHRQDHATTLIHEMTHARAVAEPFTATSDRAYGYDAVMKLDSANSLDNADTYSLYTNAVHLNC
ncbi:metalloproteinase [Pyricularia oryzae 70-15]|uniref:Neutral protease 2 n=3 Tax=Pyricularia oryzae TaxID=318829 RepID=G5EHM4_PYRO7|nr:metalloproteinase [Pyricularia oryzae 70-15]ELQ41503.1 24 kDa metalloproteinase precursor [Pyricularia oryzae Y34]KAI7917619.1 metalloproteinase [Pyricularia oryzae]EAQ71409.1 hypothetical protein MGCH7_ch7g816 [Pyricularia oryzae 70-15]EHA45915.1 metalloproteinase [Pyricularia oryzae 70-15]KAI7918017.1 metalloproteinase [Pyricularia oryzae]